MKREKRRGTKAEPQGPPMFKKKNPNKEETAEESEKEQLLRKEGNHQSGVSWKPREENKPRKRVWPPVRRL